MNLTSSIIRFADEYSREQPFFGNIRVTVRGQIAAEVSVGYSDAAQTRTLTPQSRFTLYSLSKPFCAMGLLLLRDRGTVDIDRHPGEYVPEARRMDERVTIRHLLHHTSGLPDFEQNPDFRTAYAPARLEDLRKHLSLLCDYPAYFAPGTSARYCNVNFVLCALIIENVTGIPYPDYMQKEIFEPLGMTTAVIDRPGKDIPDRVQGFAWDETARRIVPVSPSYDWLYGAGDIVGTTADVYCLHDAIRDRKLLTPSTWCEILTPSPLNNMGMGCTVSTWHGKHRITHNGGHTGFRTLHIQLPEDDFDLILLSNTGYGDARNAFSEAIYEMWYGNGNGESSVIEMDKGYAKP